MATRKKWRRYTAWQRRQDDETTRLITRLDAHHGMCHGGADALANTVGERCGRIAALVVELFHSTMHRIVLHGEWGFTFTPPMATSESNDALVFLRKRLKRVLMPTLVWTLFYMMVKLCDGDLTAKESLRAFLSIPFSAQGHGVLWFMYTLMGLYLVTPILHAWLRNACERDMRFYLSLWLVAMCYPVLGMFVDINDTPTGILYYFSGYAGYFLLGYWLQRHGDRLSLKVVTSLMCVSVAAPIVVKLMHWTVDFYSVFWYLSVFVVMQCVFWWKVIKRLQKTLRLSDGARRMVTTFSNLSFGIYLSHIFIMRHLIWKIPLVVDIQLPLIQVVVVALLTLLLSLVATWVVALTPLGNAVVGWHGKR